MELTKLKQERLVKLANKAIDTWHKAHQSDRRNFMFHYAIEETTSTIYCVHHLPEQFGGNTILQSDVTEVANILAQLSWLIIDIIDDVELMDPNYYINEDYFKDENK